MSEQAKILENMYEVIMDILKKGTPSIADSHKIEELEVLLFEQNCFKKSKDEKYDSQGEEIASLFFSSKNAQAVEKMYAYEITPEDFFGFVEYHYDEDHPDEEVTHIFTEAFIKDVTTSFQSKNG